MADSSAILAQATQKKPEGFDLYSRFAFAGALGCSVTHGAFTPVDVYDFYHFWLPEGSHRY
jgi:solute carrier family 25 phosphate transporter 3